MLESCGRSHLMSHEFSWSVSRHDTFYSCRRKYFYSYYAAAEDPEIHRLKKLSALPLWAGSLVHETIENFLKTRDAIPSETEQQAMIHAAVHGQMLSDWRESEGGSLRFRLFEHEYQVPVDKEDKKIVVGIVMPSLRSFFRSETLREAFAVGRDRWLTVEDLVSFSVDGVTVLARMEGLDDAQTVDCSWLTRPQGRGQELAAARRAKADGIGRTVGYSNAFVGVARRQVQHIARVKLPFLFRTKGVQNF